MSTGSEFRVTVKRQLPATVIISNLPGLPGLSYPVRRFARNEEKALWKKALEEPALTYLDSVNPDGSMLYLPSQIHVENTSRCNLRCRMCPQSLGKCTDADLGLANFAKIIARAGRPHSIRIQGTGEPLIDRDFFNMARLARDSGYAGVLTTTNGLLLTKERCDKLYAAGVNGVTVSVDSPDKETYEAVRVGARWDTLLKNLEYLCSHPERHKINIELVAVLHPETAPLTGKLAELAARLGVNSLTITYDLLFWGEDELEEGILRERAALLNDYASYRSFLLRAERLGIKFSVLMPAPEARIPKGVCPFFMDYAGIRSDGAVIPCCRSRAIPEFVMGNIFENTLAEIWNNEAYRAFRRAWLAGKPPPQCARNCFPDLTAGGPAPDRREARLADAC